MSFTAASWTANVLLDGADAETVMPVAKWITTTQMAASDEVAVLVFGETNTDDGLVLGPYGSVPTYNYATAPAGLLAASFLPLPGLRGLWLPGSATETGAVADLSGQGRTLAYNGNPTLNLHNSLIPYFDYDGAGDFHSRADEAGLDVLGAETYIASAYRGLTVGGWFRITTGGGFNGLISKWKDNGVNQRGYILLHDNSATPKIYGGVSGNLTNTFLTSGIPAALAAWHFCVMRFTPSTAVDVFVDGVSERLSASIPASVANSTEQLNIGGYNSVGNLAGRWAMAFLCAAAVPDAMLGELYNRTSTLFA